VGRRFIGREFPPNVPRFLIDPQSLRSNPTRVSDTTLTAKFVYDKPAWISMGASSNGEVLANILQPCGIKFKYSLQMVGSEVVMALPNDGTVLKYKLVSLDNSGVVKVPAAQQV
jgi:hypothetical protein